LTRQPVAQPVLGDRQHVDIPRLQPDFFVQLAVERIFGRFAATHAALGKLPPTAVAATAEQYVAAVPHQHDADVGAKPLTVDVVAHCRVKCRRG
jgi:hypothetical protein